MLTILATYKPEIDNRIRQLCSSTESATTPWATDVAQRLADVATLGKTVRGSILLFMVNLFRPHTDTDVNVATSLELLHTALLIHDDILDHDVLRRGKPSMQIQYETLGTELKVNQAGTFGEGMALCVGDIAIFGAFSYLAGLTLAEPVYRSILQTVTKEFLVVGFGELHDIALGYLPELPSPKEVLEMYRRKTARYTFSLPMMLGCILANQKEQFLTKVEKLGELLGLIFQLKDDLLTIQGTTQEVGKSIGNDIAEHKRTYPAVLLWQRVKGKDRNLLEKIFGKKDIEGKDIRLVTSLLEKYHVLSDLNKTINQLSIQAMQQIDLLPLPEPKKLQFTGIVQFLQTRTK